MDLNGKQRRALRALGHHLTPVVMVGKEGAGASLLAAVAQALEDHELIKVKVGESSPLDRHEAAQVLAQATGSAVAQVLGRTVLLFKRRVKDPALALPGLPLPPKEEEKVPQQPRARPRGRGSRQRQ